MRNMPARSAAVLVLLSLVLAVPAGATTYSLTPTDDVSVRSDYVHTAGTPAATLLYVGGTFVSTNDYWTTYVKFDLSSYSASGTVNSATLKMTCHSHSGSSVNVSAFEMTSDPYDWDEYWVSQAGLDSTTTVSNSAMTITTVDDTLTEFSWTVTTSASNHLGGNFTVVLKEQNQPSSGKWAKFYSKDCSVNGYKPKLVLDYTSPGSNDPRGYIDFDPSVSIDNVVVPDIYNPFDAYVTFDQMTDGLTTCSFALSVTPGISSPPSFENLLPGNLAIGSWDTGITLASTECVGVGGGPVNVGVLHLFYLGGEGDIMLLDHPDYPRWVVDCQDPGQVSYYCVLSHGGVAKEPIAGDCGATAVRDRSWSAIKAMFR